MISAADSNSPNHVRGRALVSLFTDPTLFGGMVDSAFEGDEAQATEFRAELSNQLRSKMARDFFFKQVDSAFDLPRRKESK